LSKNYKDDILTNDLLLLGVVHTLKVYLVW